MTELMRKPASVHTPELDPCGVPVLDDPVLERDVIAPIAGLAPGAVLVRVEGVLPSRPADMLAWGTVDGRKVLFTVDAATSQELQAALDAGEEPSSIVEPDQLVATDLTPAR